MVQTAWKPTQHLRIADNSGTTQLQQLWVSLDLSDAVEDRGRPRIVRELQEWRDVPTVAV